MHFPKEVPLEDLRLLVVILRDGDLLSRKAEFLDSALWTLGCVSALTFGPIEYGSPDNRKAVETLCVSLIDELSFGTESPMEGSLKDWTADRLLRTMLDALRRFLCEQWSEIMGD